MKYYPILFLERISRTLKYNMKNKEVKSKIDQQLLSRFAKNVFSQAGEDGILEKIFEILPFSDREKWCVEVGAWDGIHFSNTRNLIFNKGWSGVLIEGDKKRCVSLKETYKNNSKIECICSMVSFEGESSLDELLGKTSIPQSFDLLSIDIDGNDYHIWDSIKKYEPQVVIIEFNPSIPSDIVFIQKKDMSVQHGSSLRAFKELGKRKGYELVAATRLNGVFVRKELFPAFHLVNNEIDTLFNGKIYQTRVFQLYDSTLVVDGCDRLLWHDIPLRHAIQVLPKFLRTFSYSSNRWLRYTIFRIWRRIIKFISRPNVPYKKH